MLRNYFKIAWRNISRHRVFTIINVLGLSLGICACIVIYLVTSHDLSFDQFHSNKERIFRIVGEMQRSDGNKEFLNSPIDNVAGFQNQIPGFEAAAGFHLFGEQVSIPDGNNPPKKFGGRIESQEAWYSSSILTGPEYFNIFKYQWLAGNEKTALNDPFKVVLSEKRARLYFGDEPLVNILNKKIIYQDSLTVTVSGIVKDWNENTNFAYTDFISISTATHSFLKDRIPTEDWTSLSPHRSMAFVKLTPGTTAEQINTQFAAFIKEHVKLNNPGSKLTMYLQPITDIHFTKTLNRGDDGDNFRKAYMPLLYSLIGLAAFILFIAIVNFINLSTAQSVQRAKEIGVRKVLGSSRAKIMYQFFTETFFLTIFAVVVSVALVKPVLAAFSDYIPGTIVFNPLSKSGLIFLVTVTIATTLLAGFYPAKVLAAYLPVLSLKGAQPQGGTDKINIRKALIIFQFTCSLIFIVAVLVIGKQIHFMKTADKGFNTDAVITINNWNDHEGKLKVFAEAVRRLPGVGNSILQGAAPMGFAQNIDNYRYKDKEENSRAVLADMGNRDFIPFYDIKLIAGRNMFPSDSLNEVIINETYSKALGFSDPHDAVGKLLYRGEKAVPICGVVADYHTGSLREAIQPVIIEYVPERQNSVAIKLIAGEKDRKNVKSSLAKIEAQWKKIFPDTPFDYSFLNDSINWLYGQEDSTIWLVDVAMSITIFISCMGLFGLGMFTAERRTKEIGIRKVLGATVADITAMLSKDFVKLVLIAVVIASPVAWYFMNKWLQDFAYRTTISWWIFAVAAASAILIALFTISFQAIKAAIANPVKSLRTE